jgi:hypothetical protein
LHSIDDSGAAALLPLPQNCANSRPERGITRFDRRIGSGLRNVLTHSSRAIALEDSRRQTARPGTAARTSGRKTSKAIALPIHLIPSRQPAHVGYNVDWP